MENPEKKEKNENSYEKVENIILREVKAGDSEFDSAVEINIPESSNADIETEVRNKIKSENWWLQEEWQEKGLPKEQINIEVGKNKIALYNFGEPLEQQNFQELEGALKSLSLIANGKLLAEIKYILIDNVSSFNPKSGENFRGFNLSEMSSVRIYPEGRQIGHYGRIKDVSNFDAILIHEFSHSISQIDLDFLNKWTKKFWTFVQDFDKRRKMMGGGDDRLDYDPKNSERCVSEYAKTSPAEDLCESIVTALRNPDALDPEKLEIIKNELLVGDKTPEEVKVQKCQEIQLPKLESDTIKYKVKRFKFYWEENK